MLFRSKEEIGESVSIHFIENSSYLIGAWGNEKKFTYEELREKAKQRFLLTERNKYQEKIKDAKRSIDDLQNEVIRKFF